MSSGHQSIKRRRNIAENFNRWVRCTNVTDRRQTTDGRTTTYSEHEHEFTFAKKYSIYAEIRIRQLCVCVCVCVRSCVQLSPLSCTISSWRRSVGCVWRASSCTSCWSRSSRRNDRVFVATTPPLTACHFIFLHSFSVHSSTGPSTYRTTTWRSKATLPLGKLRHCQKTPDKIKIYVYVKSISIWKWSRT